MWPSMTRDADRRRYGEGCGFDMLRPYSYKADLARCCIASHFGGAYLDLSVNDFRGLDVSDFDFVGFRDPNNDATSWKFATHMFYSTKESPILRACIAECVENVKRRFYGKNPHFPTGSSVLGRAVASCSVEMKVQIGDFWALKGRRAKYTLPGQGVIGRGKVAGRKLGGVSGVRGGNNYNLIWQEGTIYGAGLPGARRRSMSACRTTCTSSTKLGGNLRVRNMRRDMIPSNIRTIILKLRLGKRIDVGFDTHIGPHCRLIVLKDAKLQLRSANLTRDIQLEVAPNALLEIGRSYIGQGTIISAQERVSIGDGSMIADYVTIRDQNHVHTPEVPLTDWRFTSAPVHIGNDVWIASKVTVVPGVTVADHAVCAAGAVLTKDVGPWQKVGGVPARPLKQSRHHSAGPPPRRREPSVTTPVGHGRRTTKPLGCGPFCRLSQPDAPLFHRGDTTSRASSSLAAA